VSDEDYNFELALERELAARPRDHKVDEAREALLNGYLADGDVVYYGRQLEIFLEDRFFHWITKKALNELAQEKLIGFNEKKVAHVTAHFYRPRRHRYPARQMTKAIELIREFSAPDFTEALGNHGELLADAGFASIGFRVLKKNVNEHNGVRWTKTRNNLDRIIERDGIQYGVEIKNQLGYISKEELDVKVEMAKAFGTRPMFIARMMPKSYIFEVQQNGGFCLLFKDQQYPLLAKDLAKRVRSGLKLPVQVTKAWPETALARFDKWHGDNS